MEDETCPRCKTSKYRNPSLKLMVNVCGHSLCESCVDLLFLRGSGSCPECNIPLRRCNFRYQVFEDIFVEKEVDIRKKILRDFNKKEDDFATLREYNDYLEEVENIIYNLSNDINVTETIQKIDQYKKENKEQIQKNKSRMSREEFELQELLDIEKQQEEYRKHQIEEDESETKRKKLRVKEELIDELMFSNENAKRIVDNFVEAIRSDNDVVDGSRDEKSTITSTSISSISSISTTFNIPTKFSSGIQFSNRTHTNSNFISMPIDEGLAYVFKPYQLLINGPKPPSFEEIETKGYLQHIRAETVEEIAAGFKSNYACLKAIQEAFCGLYYV